MYHGVPNHPQSQAGSLYTEDAFGKQPGLAMDTPISIPKQCPLVKLEVRVLDIFNPRNEILTRKDLISRCSAWLPLIFPWIPSVSVHSSHLRCGGDRIPTGVRLPKSSNLSYGSWGKEAHEPRIPSTGGPDQASGTVTIAASRRRS